MKLTNNHLTAGDNVKLKGIKLSEAATKTIINDLVQARSTSKESKEFVRRSKELIKELNKKYNR